MSERTKKIMNLVNLKLKGEACIAAQRTRITKKPRLSEEKTNLTRENASEQEENNNSIQGNVEVMNSNVSVPEEIIQNRRLAEENNNSTHKNTNVIESDISIPEEPQMMCVEEPQPSSSDDRTRRRKETRHYVVQHSSDTKLALKKVRNSESYSSDESSKLFSSGSSDNYEPSCTSESSSEYESSSNYNSTSLGPSIDIPMEEEEGVTTIGETEQQAANNEQSTTIKKSKKRMRNEANWRKVKSKTQRNSGQSYTSRTGKVVGARKMGPPCTDKCLQSCSDKFTENYRCELFTKYWALGSLQRQRDFLNSCIQQLNLSYRRVSAQKPRKPNCAFYLMNGDKKVRVCKTFFINTLGISERAIRTVIQGKFADNGFTPTDNRGKHDNRKKIPEEVLKSVRSHINSIPRIESHYLRRDTSREYIDGGLSIAEMHRNYSSNRASLNKMAANYDTYARIFNSEFNIGFFIPKKDQCVQCVAYLNAEGEEKAELEEVVQQHQKEKLLSRQEKDTDKQKAEKEEIKVAVYDLQAVLPVPVGQSSAFYYKSRLNCFNFTVSFLTTLFLSR